MNQDRHRLTMRDAIVADAAGHEPGVGRRVADAVRLATGPFVRFAPWRVRQWWDRLLPAAMPMEVHGQSATSETGLRAVLVTHDLSDSGAPRLVFEMAMFLRRRGDEVLVVSPGDGPFRHALAEGGVAVVIDRALVSGDSRPVRVVAGMADLAICNTVVVTAAVATLSPRVPVIWYIHETSLLEQRLDEDPALAPLLSKPARLWGVSERTARILRGHRADVQLMPYGLQPIGEAPPAGSRAGQPLRIGIFGSIEMRKGQDLAVAALRLLSEEDRNAIALVIHGRVLEPEYDEALRHDARSLPQVSIGPALGRGEVDQAMLACDAVLMPSRDDPLPMVTADPLGCGRVLMCTRTTGTSAYLTPGIDGFVAEQPTAEAIASMLREAIARRSEWPAIGAAGRDLFERIFSKAAFEQQFERDVEAVKPR